MMVQNTTPWWLPGAFLVVFGLLIVVFPELLAMLVASALLLVGVSWLTLGWTAQRNRRRIPVQYYMDGL